MGKLVMFFVLNIISFVASFSAMGTGNPIGFFIGFGCWALIVYMLGPKSAKRKG